MVKTDFKLRYQGSLLGYLWSLLKPLFLFGILYVVFVKIVRVNFGVENSGGYLLLGIVLWSFFAELTGGSVTAVAAKGDLLRKINFPKHVIVLAVAFSVLINLTLNLLVVGLFIVIGGTEIDFRILLAPLLLFQLFTFSLGIGFFLAAAYIKLRDISHIWEVTMQALFYLTPILFPVAFAPIWLQKILILNPLAQIIQDLRYILISHRTVTIDNVYVGKTYIRLIPITITVLTLVLSAYYFKSKSKYFAEEV